MTTNTDILDLVNDTDFIEDHSEVKSGGYEKKLIAEGKHLTRFIGYIELGVQKQRPYQGKPKAPAHEVELVFEVFGKDNITEVTKDDGTKVVHGVIHREKITKVFNEKSKFHKLFKKLAQGKPNTKNLAQLLNSVYYFTFKHAKGSDGKTDYANVYVDSAYNITEAVFEQFDDSGNILGVKSLADKCPPASLPLRLFLYNQPNQKQWDSLFIEGTYKKKIKTEDDTEIETEASKNFYQETILSSLEYEGSPLHKLLAGVTKAVEEIPVTTTVAAPVKASVVSDDELSLVTGA